MSKSPKRYYAKNGSLYGQEDYLVPNVLIGSRPDLVKIHKDVRPGTLAHEPGYTAIYEFGPDHLWYEFPDSIPVYETSLDGTNTTQVFKTWWDAERVAHPDENRYVTLDRFFALLQEVWDGRYYTLRYENALLNTATGDPTMTPLGNLKGKSPAPCLTAYDEDFFHWMDEDPMYWYVRFNGLSLADGTMNILAVEGVDDTFDITGELAPVYTGSIALWVANYILGEYEYKTIATKNDGKLRPLACDVAPDGEPRHMSWHATFGGSLNSEDKLTSGAWKAEGYSGTQFGVTNESASQGLISARLWDEYEGLYSDTDREHLIWMWQFRHFNLSNSGILNGCSNYYKTINIAVAETDVNHVTISDEEYDFVVVGSNYVLQNITANMNNKITTVVSKDHVIIDEVQYCQIIFDIDEANITTTTSSKIQNRGWFTGTTESVPTHKDGSLGDCLSGKYPARIAGIEILDGTYAAGMDPIIVSTYTSAPVNCNYKYYAVTNSEEQGTVTTNAAVEEAYPLVAELESLISGWRYISHYELRTDGMLIPDSFNGSSTTSYKSALNFAAYSSVCVPCSFGRLGNGDRCGLGCSIVNLPSVSVWGLRPRLSGCGKKRGEWAGAA